MMWHVRLFLSNTQLMLNNTAAKDIYKLNIKGILSFLDTETFLIVQAHQLWTSHSPIAVNSTMYFCYDHNSLYN